MWVRPRSPERQHRPRAPTLIVSSLFQFHEKASFFFNVPLILAHMAYQGCFEDTPARNFASKGKYAPDNLTNLNCVTLCLERGYPLAGTQYGQACRCGLQVKDGPRSPKRVYWNPINISGPRLRHISKARQWMQYDMPGKSRGKLWGMVKELYLQDWDTHG